MKETQYEDEYYLFKTIKNGNITINIHRPILSKEERKRRTDRLCDTLMRLAIENLSLCSDKDEIN